MEKVRLFHETNKSAYLKMQESGFAGLDKKDYDIIAEKIINHYNITSEYMKTRIYSIMHSQFNLQMYFKKDENYSLQLQNGCVSFFPHLDQYKYFSAYGTNGGEILCTEVKNVLKSIARHKKVLYNDLKDKDAIIEKYTGLNSGPVVLEFIIPKNLLSHFTKHKYDIGMEICSKAKVSMKYFIKKYDIINGELTDNEW